MFSPYYAGARRRGPADPEQHVAINCALYGAAGKRWAMTERTRRDLARSADVFHVGRSSLAWEGDTLVARIDEITNPLPSRLTGTIRLHPQTRPGRVFEIAPGHLWWPVAPTCRVEVDFTSPGLRWQGHGYHDANAGREPLEAGFREWDWSRARIGDESVVFYDAVRRGAGPQGEPDHPNLALRFRADGSTEPFDPPPRTPLATTLWRVPRMTRSEGEARVVATFEDTPFYTRSAVAARLDGAPVTMFHESLSLDRFSARWVQALLPFRMPRRA